MKNPFRINRYRVLYRGFQNDYVIQERDSMLPWWWHTWGNSEGGLYFEKFYETKREAVDHLNHRLTSLQRKNRVVLVK